MALLQRDLTLDWVACAWMKLDLLLAAKTCLVTPSSSIWPPKSAKSASSLQMAYSALNLMNSSLVNLRRKVTPAATSV